MDDKHEQARLILANTLASFNDDSLAFIETLREKTLLSLCIIDTPPEPDYDDIVSLATALGGAPTAALTFIGGQDAWIKSAHGADFPRKTERKHSFCNITINDPLNSTVINDAEADPRLRDNPWVVDEKIRFYAGAPILMPDGVAVGALCVFDYVPREITPEQVRNLEILARIVVKFLEQRRSHRSQ